jgi:type IV secretory pathway VirB10-like protein
MRVILALLCLASFAPAQSSPATSPATVPAVKPDTAAAPATIPAVKPASPGAASELMIPSGTKVPIELKHAVSSKGTHEGDGVYAETTFPVVGPTGRVLIPAGTYVQGTISHIQRGGHIKGRAEVLMHFSTLIYPSGYTVFLPGAVENAPGVDKTSVKDDEGTIRSDSQTGEKVGTVATTAGTGAAVGGITNGARGALIGGGIGGAIGSAIAFLGRGNDVKLDAGTTLEIVIQRDVPLDPTRVPTTTRAASTTP